MSCHRSSSSLWNWNIDYAELWSYLVVWERWLRGENVPLLLSLPIAGSSNDTNELGRDTLHAASGHGHEIRHLQCLANSILAGFFDSGNSRIQAPNSPKTHFQTLPLVSCPVSSSSKCSSVRVSWKKSWNTHLLIAKDPAKSHFNVGLIYSRWLSQSSLRERHPYLFISRVEFLFLLAMLIIFIFSFGISDESRVGVSKKLTDDRMIVLFCNLLCV